MNLINSNTYSALIRETNSTYLQRPHCDKVLGYKSMVKSITEFGGELIFIDFEQQFRFILTNDEINERGHWQADSL